MNGFKMHGFIPVVPRGLEKRERQVSTRLKPLTLQASLSTRATMEFLKSVAAVRGRLVTSVMLKWPSGHISFRTWLELHRAIKKRT